MKVDLIKLQSHGDDRGALVALEEQVNIPFQIKRAYYIFDTKPGVKRGFHAHKQLRQLAVVLRGECKFLLDDGKEKREVLLNEPSTGLLIESFVWREMYDFSDDCVLLVLADSLYDESDYVRNYEDFILEANKA